MTETLRIYGASDDLIEVVGAVDDEFDAPYNKPALVTVLADDAHYVSLVVEYDQTGEWRIQPTSLGGLVEIVPARGEDAGDDEDRCPGYSDKAVIDLGGIEPRRVTIRVTALTAPRETDEMPEEGDQ